MQAHAQSVAVTVEVVINKVILKNAEKIQKSSPEFRKNVEHSCDLITFIDQPQGVRWLCSRNRRRGWGETLRYFMPM
jgi:hypothetical protein